MLLSIRRRKPKRDSSRHGGWQTLVHRNMSHHTNRTSPSTRRMKHRFHSQLPRKVVRELKTKAIALINEMDGGSGLGDGLRKILERMDIEKPSEEHFTQQNKQ